MVSVYLSIIIYFVRITGTDFNIVGKNLPKIMNGVETLLLDPIYFPKHQEIFDRKYLWYVTLFRNTREIALMIQLEQQQHGEFWVGR